MTRDRFLVDPWLYHYYGEAPVLDLAVPAEQRETVARYVRRIKWERLPDQPQRANEDGGRAGVRPRVTDSRT